jgi:cyclophilin family peptidyl-prolyl cis-trans isomerase
MARNRQHCLWLPTAILALLLMLALAGAGCSDDSGTQDGGSGKDSGPTPDTVAGPPRVKLVTSMGDITLELNDTKAPKTVANFLTYVNAKSYDGTIFHRVIKTFMIQGGGYDTSFNRRSTNAPIQNEANNGLSNLRGTIAMARTSDPHSATNQFFINVVDNKGLDYTSSTTSGWGYAVFGKVITGMDTVDKIKDVPTGAKGPFTKDAPLTNVVITSATVVK